MVKPVKPEIKDVLISEFFRMNPKLHIMIERIKDSPIYKMVSLICEKCAPEVPDNRPVVLTRAQFDSLCAVAIIGLEMCDAVAIV